MKSDDFEILDHTADVGIRVRADSLPGLYAAAAQGFLRLLCEPASVRAEDAEVVEVQGGDAVELMVSWLHEILFRVDARRRVYASASVDEFSEWRLRATLKGEAFDPARHERLQEIKAVTYYGARVEREGERWLAELVFDI